MRFIQIAVLAFLTVGCVAQKSITEQGIAFNKALSDFNNKQLLLNIARASRREPMVFTAYSKFSDTQTTEVKGGLSITKLFDGEEGYGTSPTYSHTTKPVFDMAPLDSKEFAKLIAEPIGAKELEFYFESGWPDDLIVTLFVNSISIEKDGETIVYNNHPNDDPKEQGKFGTFVSERFFSICNRPKKSEVSFPVVKDWSEHLDKFVEFSEKGYTWKVTGGASTNLSVEREYKEYFLCTQLKGGNLSPQASSFKEFGKGEIRLRSIEGALYYLGEILRNRNSEGNCVRTKMGGKDVPLFAAEKFPVHAIPWIDDGVYTAPSICNGPYKSLVLSVRDGDYVYAILGNNEETGVSQGRSMHALTLISQLIALKKAPELLVTSQTLRLE